MASASIAEKDADQAGPVPCPSSVQTSPSRQRDRDVDTLLLKAGLGLEVSPDGDDSETVGGGMMPALIQRLATVRSFTVMCCALAALTGTIS